MADVSGTNRWMDGRNGPLMLISLIYGVFCRNPKQLAFRSPSVIFSCEKSNRNTIESHRKFETARIPLATIFFLLLILFTSTVNASWYTEVREPKMTVSPSINRVGSLGTPARLSNPLNPRRPQRNVQIQRRTRWKLSESGRCSREMGKGVESSQGGR